MNEEAFVLSQPRCKTSLIGQEDLSELEAIVAPAPVAYASRVNDDDGACFNCGKQGHWSRECPDKKRNGDNGGAKSGNQTKASASAESTGGDTGTKSEPTKKKKDKKSSKGGNHGGYAMEVDPYGDIFGYACDSDAVSSRHPRAVSIDSLANHSFGWNEELFDDVRDQSFTMTGVGGRSAGSRVGRLACFGPVVITPKAKVNAIALCDAERYTVKYEQGLRYTVELSDDFVLEFRYCEQDKSYTCIFTDDIIDALHAYEAGIGIHTVTVAEKEKQYSKAEVHGARTARQLMRRLYYPSEATLVNMLSSGRLLNAPVTPHDVLRATDIYGKDVPSLKGKTVDHGPIATRDLLVPKSMQKEQHVHADLFNWKSNWFLLFIVKPLGLLMVDWIPSSRNAESLLQSVNKMLGKVRARGYDVERVTTDPERALAKLDGMVNCAWDTVGSRDHEEHAEREIRLIRRG